MAGGRARFPKTATELLGQGVTPVRVPGQLPGPERRREAVFPKGEASCPCQKKDGRTQANKDNRRASPDRIEFLSTPTILITVMEITALHGSGPG